MSIVNTKLLKESDKRIADLINSLGSILDSQNYKIYHKFITNIHYPNDNEKDEKKTEFLIELYNSLLNEFKNLRFDSQ